MKPTVTNGAVTAKRTSTHATLLTARSSRIREGEPTTVSDEALRDRLFRGHGGEGGEGGGERGEGGDEGEGGEGGGRRCAIPVVDTIAGTDLVYEYLSYASHRGRDHA